MAPPSLLDELSAFVATIDRPAAIFWGTNITCWLITVAIVMVWGLD